MNHSTPHPDNGTWAPTAEPVPEGAWEAADGLAGRLGVLHGTVTVIVKDGRAVDVRHERRLLRGK